MRAKAILVLLVFTGASWADDGEDYGSSSSTYGSGYVYDRERAEAPSGYITNGPITVPTYPGGYAISNGSGSGKDFVGSTTTNKGSCYSAFGITSCY